MMYVCFTSGTCAARPARPMACPFSLIMCSSYKISRDSYTWSKRDHSKNKSPYKLPSYVLILHQSLDQTYLLMVGGAALPGAEIDQN